MPAPNFFHVLFSNFICFARTWYKISSSVFSSCSTLSTLPSSGLEVGSSSLLFLSPLVVVWALVKVGVAEGGAPNEIGGGFDVDEDAPADKEAAAGAAEGRTPNEKGAGAGAAEDMAPNEKGAGFDVAAAGAGAPVAGNENGFVAGGGATPPKDHTELAG